MLESSTVRDPPSSGCHHRLPSLRGNERIFRLLGSIWWRSSLPQWMGQPGSGQGGFFDFKDSTRQITLEKKIYPKTSWKLEDDPFWEGIGQASNYVTEGNGINIPWNTESHDAQCPTVLLEIGSMGELQRFGNGWRLSWIKTCWIYCGAEAYWSFSIKRWCIQSRTLQLWLVRSSWGWLN